MNKAEQVHEHIEHGRNEGQTCLNVNGQPMPNSFQVADDRDQRQSCFDLASWLYPVAIIAERFTTCTLAQFFKAANGRPGKSSC